MNSQLRTLLLAVLAPTAIVSGWLWMTALEIEEELNQPEYTIPERFLNEPRTGPIVDPDEIDTTKILEPEPQHGWIVPPEPLRKAAGKVKRKIKKTVKKG